MNKMSFDEYKNEVIRNFYQLSGIPEKDAVPFLNSAKVQSKIKSSYKYFQESPCFEPKAVASCLDMMYE